MISFIRSKKDRVKLAKAGEIVTIGDMKGKISKGDKVYKITSKSLNEELKQYFSGKSIKKNNLDLKITLNIDEVPEVEVSTEMFGKKYTVIVKEGTKCEKGINKTLTEQDVRNQFIKTGDVPFKVNDIKINLQAGLMTTMSNLNNIRRQAIEKLSKKIIDSFKRDKVNIQKETDNKKVSIANSKKDTKLSLYIYNIQNLDNLEILNKVDRVYISLEDMINGKERILKHINKEKICIYLPTVTNKKYKEYITENIEIIEEVKNILVTNIEHLEMFKNMNLNIYLDNSFNIFNSQSLKRVTLENIKGVNLSSELTLEQIGNIKTVNNKEIEVDVYGNLEVMYSKFCILNATKNCKKCKSVEYSLIDRKDKKFPVIFNNKQCTMQILNADKLFSEEAIKQLNSKVDYMRVYVYDENTENIKNVINGIQDILNSKEMKNKIISNNTQKYTNGHFFRGV